MPFYGCVAFTVVFVAELVITVSTSCALEPVESSPVPVVLGPNGLASAEWARGTIPELLPFLSDPYFLKNEHLLFTVRKKTGQVFVRVQAVCPNPVVLTADAHHRGVVLELAPTTQESAPNTFLCTLTPSPHAHVYTAHVCSNCKRAS